MKRTTLTIAAIVAAIAIYDRTAATSSEPAPRTVSGGPTVVLQTFDTAFDGSNNETWKLVAETSNIEIAAPVTVIADLTVRLASDCTRFRNEGCDLRLFDGSNPTSRGGVNPGETSLDDTFFNLNFPDRETHGRRLTAGSAVTLQPGTYAFRAYIRYQNLESTCFQRVDVEGWLRLQIWGCDSPAGCIPGDLNLDGRVNLLDFAILANNFQG